MAFVARTAPGLCTPVQSAKDPGELTQLAEGVYVRIVTPDSNAVSNAGVVVMERSVMVFDTHFTLEAGQALLAKIQAVTNKPVHYIVNSHFHADHTHGNQAFSTAHQIIGSTWTRRDMLQKDLPALNRTLSSLQDQLEKSSKDVDQEQDEKQRESMRAQIRRRQDFFDHLTRLKIIPPEATLDDNMSVLDGQRRMELLYLGAGHTDGDVVLHLPAEKIAFVGDLFFNAALPSTQDANLLEWMKALDELLKLDVEKFVPGHGGVGGRRDVQDFLSYLQELKAMVEPAVARGDSLEQVLGELRVPAKFASYSFQNFFPANVQKMYAELKAMQLASPLMVPADSSKKPQPEKPRP